jgi:tRNA (adenine22-N1)-methyltransferase
MSEIILSKRLSAIANWVPAGSRVADIGSDHALLPCAMAEQGKVSYALAGELNEGPFQAASKQIRSSGLTAIVEARKGDGLTVVEASDAIEVITISGMGGALISHILTEGASKLANVRRLVLQPNVGEDHVRRWLVANGWLLLDEQILEEDGKFYEVLVAERAGNAAANNESLYTSRKMCNLEISCERLLQMGPFLIERAGDVYVAKWTYEIGKLRKVIAELQHSTREEAKERTAAFQEELDEMEEILTCLQTDKR